MADVGGGGVPWAAYARLAGSFFTQATSSRYPKRLSPADRQSFIAAGGSIAGRLDTRSYSIGGRHLTNAEARLIAQQFRARGAVTPDSPVPYIAATTIGTAFPRPPSDEVARARAAKKAREAAAKRAKFLKANSRRLLKLARRFPLLGKIIRYSRPTGYLLLAQDIYTNREKYWAAYKAWEAKQPRVSAQVIRAPGPGAIPRGSVWGPAKKLPAVGLPTRELPSGPATRARVMRLPEAANLPTVVTLPKGNAGAVRVIPVPASRPAPARAPAAAPGTRPGAAPRRAATTTWASKAIAAYTAVSPYLKSAQTSVGKTYLTVNQGVPLTALQPQALPFPQLATQTAKQKCKCPPKRKKSGKQACSNPRTSSRTYTRGGQKYRTTTRRLICQA